MQSANTNGRMLDDSEKAKLAFQIESKDLVDIVQAYKSRTYN